ncbi:dormancy-associated protein homolog 3 isoform X1 [Primulina tabacum]|uniref:dormancy-associated protein homolog 3 isoform X1 n=1 Tax=Primulina tabacum TaxID=48773 RepID=UPI003F599FCC
MGLLDQLWDDTVAGPLPDNGLGKLRKHSTFSFRSNSPKESEGSSRRSMGEEAAEDVTRVTRSIMIVKPQQLSMKDSPPVSPAGSTPPVSPFSGKVEGEKPFGLGANRHPLLMKGLAESDPGALLLLTTCEL